MKSMSVKEFGEWMATARRGFRIQYHLGFLGQDRSTDVFIGKRMYSVPNSPADNIGNATYAAYEDGLVHLVQTKVTDGVYEYWAVRR